MKKKKSYPKLLPWKAAKHHVEDEQAKIAWGQTMLLANILMAEEDHEFINMQLDTRLKTLGFLNDMMLKVLSMSKAEKFKLEHGD